MKRIMLATSFVVGLMTSGALMALDAPGTSSPPVDVRSVESDAALQIGDRPLLLAEGDAWEMRSERLQQPLSRKVHRPMRQDVRETNPWWR